jgi:hypothetical protein
MQLEVFFRGIDMEFRMLVDLINRLNANEREYHRTYLYGKIKEVLQSLGTLMHELVGLEAPSTVGRNCVDVPPSLIIGVKSTTDPDSALCHG